MSVVVVIGASRGIGLHLVKKLVAADPKLAILSENFKIVATARNVSGGALNDVAASSGDRVDILPLDITDEASVDTFVSTLSSKYTKVDLVIFNAGVSGESSPITNVSKKDLVDTFVTNAYAPIHLANKMLPLLKKSNDPRAVFVSTYMSSSTLLSDSYASSYRASKSALNVLVQCLAKDEPSVAFMLVHPGWVKTDMGGENAPVMPEDSAAGILATTAKFCVKEHSADALYTFEGQTLPW